MDQISKVVAKCDFGKASAAKRGKNASHPYVPILDFGEQKIGRNRTRTEQIRNRAFKSRAEAVGFATLEIERRRAALEEKLRHPRHRALRMSYGLPAELSPNSNG